MTTYIERIRIAYVRHGVGGCRRRRRLPAVVRRPLVRYARQLGHVNAYL
jgi:hypothetical protein